MRAPTNMPNIDRFMRFVVKLPNGCWQWTGPMHANGYGTFWAKGRVWHYAHRWSHEHFIGPIPDGLQIDHLCRNRACANPDHLEAVSPRENCLRSTSFVAIYAASDKCVNGHEFTPENTYHRPDRPEGRGRCCRECRRDRDRQRPSGGARAKAKRDETARTEPEETA